MNVDVYNIAGQTTKSLREWPRVAAGGGLG